MWVPAVTGNAHCISGLPLGSQRSSLKIASGVPAGTEAFAPIVPNPAELLPLLRYGLGSVVSAAQSGPPSVEAISGPPAFTRYRTEVSRGPAKYTLPGSVA